MGRQWVSAIAMDLNLISSLPHSCKFFKSKHRRMRQWEKHIRKKEERKETVEQQKADMKEIGERQKRMRKEQEQIREKFEEIESECHKLKQETMNTAKKSARNQIRINLMLDILKARHDNNFVLAHHLTQLLREEMGKQKQGNQSSLADCGCN